jgi:uncharacterized RDD family membrane protein YckC
LPDTDYLISTPENVDLHLELAGLGNRILACFVDTLISYLVIILILAACAGSAYWVDEMSWPREARTLAYYYLGAVAILTTFVVIFGYFIFFEGTWQGQTPGKKFAGIRVIESNGQPVSWSSVIVRNLIRIVDTGLGLVGLVTIFADASERRLGDLAAGTIVIRERQAAKEDLTVTLTPDLTPNLYFDVGQITPDEYELLVSFLSRRPKFAPGKRPLLAHKLEEYFKQKIQTTTDDPPEIFLEKIYLAYKAQGKIS